MTPSSSVKRDAALDDRLASFLLDEGEVDALRTGQDLPGFNRDGVREWFSKRTSEPYDTLLPPPDVRIVEPGKCGDAVRQSYNFDIAGWTGFARFRRFGNEGSKYEISQSVAAYPDMSAAKHAYAGIADKVRACGNMSGTVGVNVSGGTPIVGPFSMEMRDNNDTSLRWTYISHRFYEASSPQYSTEVMLAVVNNIVVCTSASRFSDSEHLTTALMQALTQRITSSR
ncbi:sensor domain-containing protein [Nocardia arthritidis]|uniref:sensor domain-containing protein n=1 Tax=Nocardia arthritidis TaxID=228602 RepID=UPI00142DA908|nr:sensor domain-containing protein [Nocardia arthritidis]